MWTTMRCGDATLKQYISYLPTQNECCHQVQNKIIELGGKLTQFTSCQLPSTCVCVWCGVVWCCEWCGVVWCGVVWCGVLSGVGGGGGVWGGVGGVGWVGCV